MRHPDIAALGRLLLDAGLVERIDEGGGAAVEDRHFRPFDLDRDIVDAEPEQGCHQMLDGGDMASRWIAENGAEIGRADFRDKRPDLVAAVSVDALKDNAGVGIGWIEMDRDGLTAMNADARQCNA